MTEGMPLQELSKITCSVPAALAPELLDILLEGLGLPEVYVQHGKELSLVEDRGLLGGHASLAEDRAEIFRFYLPREFEAAAAERIVEAADLHIPGRGVLYAEDVRLGRPDSPAFDLDRLSALVRPERGAMDYTVLCCIVQRGEGEALARSVLEMGLSVPIVSYGRGMGLRNRLGLLRITVPVEKEVVYCAVPSADAELVAGLAARKARLDMPGRGFMYRYPVRARAVNSRIRRGRRRHVATMEQIIGALDELRGSTDWRRLAPSAAERNAEPKAGGPILVCMSIICEEGRAAALTRAAMDAGAGGATLVKLGYRGPDREAAPLSASHARETCDLIVPEELVPRLLDLMEGGGLFSPESHGLVEITRVERPVTYMG